MAVSPSTVQNCVAVALRGEDGSLFKRYRETHTLAFLVIILVDICLPSKRPKRGSEAPHLTIYIGLPFFPLLGGRRQPPPPELARDVISTMTSTARLRSPAGGEVIPGRADHFVVCSCDYYNRLLQLMEIAEVAAERVHVPAAHFDIR